jgi:hypothetical protein
MNIVEFERDMNALIIQKQHPVQDLKESIASAVLSKCDKRSAIHMHLRLKHGANAGPHAMSRHELADLVEMMASDHDIAQRMANFYARIAVLRARIEALRSAFVSVTTTPPESNHDPSKYETHLLAEYAKNEERMREKCAQHQRELDRIMQTLFQESAIHPDLTEDDLLALEAHVEHIAERGCAAQELRRLKIVEAVLEERRFNELTSII